MSSVAFLAGSWSGAAVERFDVGRGHGDGRSRLSDVPGSGKDSSNDVGLSVNAVPAEPARFSVLLSAFLAALDPDASSGRTCLPGSRKLWWVVLSSKQDPMRSFDNHPAFNPNHLPTSSI